jgi:hypothetical protein
MVGRQQQLAVYMGLVGSSNFSALLYLMDMVAAQQMINSMQVRAFTQLPLDLYTSYGFSFAVTLAWSVQNKEQYHVGQVFRVGCCHCVLHERCRSLEGMQIAFFAVAKIPASERGDSVFAKKTCELLFKA